jgi:hypothetical protein
MTPTPSATKLVCIHGHFYQPPRENPWLEAVEVEGSAAPFHDWNARIDAECYAANAVSRIHDDSGLVSKVVNNYEAISFDFGPTLLSWLEDADPQTYDAVIAADRGSAAAHAGHGNAMAQAYNHMILPLANARDKETQVRWGIADFTRRYGRRPEGLWLPETAVDLATLEALAEQGISFTVLAPHQATEVRPIGGADAAWEPVPESSIDTTQPYLCTLGGGRSIALFFYNDSVARAVAFEGLLGDGSGFVRRIASSFREGVDRPQLVHIATDGESYGHHHRHGDRALAFAARSPDVALTNYGEFLALCPPTMEVRIAERTSWSCSHGVGRWSRDCGCRYAGGSQAWRATLREAMDWLRDEVDALFEARAGELLRDPWEARNRYVEVVLDRNDERIDAFLDEHARTPLDRARRVDAISLLEMERHRMLMFTSCGWFFDDCAGIEPVQILKYAARAIELAGAFGADGLEQRFVDRLQTMVSNDPRATDGPSIYRQRVRPSMVDPRRVAAYHAIASLFEADGQAERRRYCYQLRDLDRIDERDGRARLAVGRVRVESLVTRATEDVTYGLLHLGGHDFDCALRGADAAESHVSMRDALLATFRSGSLSDVIHDMDRQLGGRHLGLRDLFLEGRRTVLAAAAGVASAEIDASSERSYGEHRKLLDALREASVPLPSALARIVELALERRTLGALERLAAEPREPAAALDRIEELAWEARRRGVRLDAGVLARPLEAALEALAERLVPGWSLAAVGALRRALALGAAVGAAPRLWEVQNQVLWSLAQRRPREPRPEIDALLADLGISRSVLHAEEPADAAT